MARHVSYEEYLTAVVMTLARRHKPVWSWRNWRAGSAAGST
jgi:hypothetical protein